MIMWATNATPTPRRYCNARTRRGWPCTRAALPGEKRCRQHRHRPPAEPIGWDGRFPILAARRTYELGDTATLTVDCPWCGAEHHHGAGRELGSGDGSRVPHCSEGAMSGQYILREVRG